MYVKVLCKLFTNSDEYLLVSHGTVAAIPEMQLKVHFFPLSCRKHEINEVLIMNP